MAPPARQPIVGFVVAHPIRGKIGRILTLDIVPEARRSGLASRLMQECEQRLRAAGCTLVSLETAVNNEPALRLYRKLGYEIVRTLPKYYSSQSLDAYSYGETSVSKVKALCGRLPEVRLGSRSAMLLRRA